MNFSDIIGAAGVSLLLLAFVLAGIKSIKQDGVIYFALNSIGAGMACYASWLINYKPFVVLEGVWTVVSVIGLLRSFKNV